MMLQLRTKAPFLLHRIDEPQTNAWYLSESHRRRVGDMLAKKYRQTIGLLDAGFRLIARIDTNGAVTCLPPPFAEYHFSLIANKPKPPECVCAGFFDPEAKGPWRERGSADHHPLCQFDATSIEVYNDALRKGESRANEGLSAQERPDDWIRLRQERQGR